MHHLDPLITPKFIGVVDAVNYGLKVVVVDHVDRILRCLVLCPQTQVKRVIKLAHVHRTFLALKHVLSSERVHLLEVILSVINQVYSTSKQTQGTDYDHKRHQAAQREQFVEKFEY